MQDDPQIGIERKESTGRHTEGLYDPLYARRTFRHIKTSRSLHLCRARSELHRTDTQRKIRMDRKAPLPFLLLHVAQTRQDHRQTIPHEDDRIRRRPSDETHPQEEKDKTNRSIVSRSLFVISENVHTRRRRVPHRDRQCAQTIVRQSDERNLSSGV